MRATTAALIHIALTLASVGLSDPGHANDWDGEKFSSEAEKLGLIERAVARWKTVNRWLIEYEATPSAANTESIPVHKIMAVSEPGDFYSMLAHFPRTNPWQVDPFCQELFVHQGSVCHGWRFNRAYSERNMKAGDYVPGTTWKDVLFAIIPRWPLSEYRMPAHPSFGTPTILIEALQSVECRLLAKSEPISGEDCAVLDYKGIDRFWISTNNGLCLMRRDTRDPRSKKLLVRVLTDKVDQVAPGLWLPTDYRIQFFSAGHRTNKKGISSVAGIRLDSSTIEQENRIRILRCVLNDDVPESTFIPIHRPGSIKYDKEENFSQVSPGGEDLLDDIVHFMAKYGNLPTQPVPRNHSWLWLLGGLGTGLCAGFLLFPKSRAVQ